MLSPADGKIITAYPDLAVGQFFAKGDLFAIVEDSSRLIADIKLAEKYISNVKVGADVNLKMWADPSKKYTTKVLSVSPVAYEQSRGRIIRSLTEREWLSENEQIFKRRGQVVRVLAELPNNEDNIKILPGGPGSVAVRPHTDGGRKRALPGPAKPL